MKKTLLMVWALVRTAGRFAVGAPRYFWLLSRLNLRAMTVWNIRPENNSPEAYEAYQAEIDANPLFAADVAKIEAVERWIVEPLEGQQL